MQKPLVAGSYDTDEPTKSLPNTFICQRHFELGRKQTGFTGICISSTATVFST